LIASLEGPASIDVGAVLCNKMPPAALTAAEERDAGLVRSLDGLANGEISRRGDCLGDAVARFSAARARRTSAVARASRLRACAGEAAFAVVAAAHHDPVATVAAAIAEEAL
jgi:hypothetical protein